jgi:hypothetical protein
MAAKKSKNMPAMAYQLVAAGWLIGGNGVEMAAASMAGRRRRNIRNHQLGGISSIYGVI